MDFKHRRPQDGHDRISEEDRHLIEKFLKKKKITKCPPMTFTPVPPVNDWGEMRKRHVRIAARQAKFEAARAKREGK